MSDSDEDYDPAAVAPRLAAPNVLETPNADASTGPVPRPVLTAASLHAPLASSSSSSARPPPSSSLPVPPPVTASAATEACGEAGLRLHGIKGPVRSLCLTSTATTLCAAGQDGQLCMWDFTVPLAYRRLQPTRVLTPFVNRIAGLQPIVSVHCACDDAYFVACQDGDSPVLISATGKQLETCAMGERGMLDVVKCKAHRAPVTCSAPHPTTSAVFFTGAQDGTARRWDANAVTRGSTYAIKHGTGQITDKVIVESVCGLQSTGSGQVFVSGGEDGCVQLWDARVKYRPGGSMSRWDVCQGGSFASDSDGFFSSSHVGGLLEVASAGAGPSTLVVRTGERLHCLDLRASKGNTATPAKSSVTGLSAPRDTIPLAAGHAPGSFYTSTGHEGFQQQIGGHVVGFTCDAESAAPRATSLWRAGGRESKEDVLCVAVDRSHAAGTCFAGLDNGDVAVLLGAGAQEPVREWLATRPTHENDGHGGRTAGFKSTRAEALANDDEEPLF